MKLDKKYIAQMNKKAVLDIIRIKGPINRAKIAKLTGLSVPTVMKITDNFNSCNLIRVNGKGKSNGGKRPKLYEIVSNAYYMIGVDIGRSKTTVIVMDLEGKIINRRVTSTGKTNPSSDLIERVISTIDKTISKTEIPLSKMLGIGVVTPGLIDVKSGSVVFSPNFQWENVKIKELIQNAFGIQIQIESSNRAMAIGENLFGAAKDSSYNICINLGYGIGSAIVKEGELYRGKTGNSGEIGHITLEKEGPICECGNRGCLEALASGKAIAESAKAYIRNGAKSKILDLVQNNTDKIEAKDVFESAKLGDKLSNQIVDNALEYLAIGIANYINLLDPNLIVLSGGIMNSSEFFLERLAKMIKTKQMKSAATNIIIRVTELGADATAIGAASLILKQFIAQGGSTRRRRKGNE